MAESAQPLFRLAAKKVAQNRKYVLLALDTVPKEVSEEIVPHMDALSLSEFIESKKGIMEIKESFSIHGFQKFLLHFFLLLDKELHIQTKIKMLQQYKQFKDEYKDHLDYLEPFQLGRGKSYNRITLVDWVVRSIGIFDGLDQTDAFISTHEQNYFKSKFAIKNFPTLRVPIPVLPNKLLNLLPSSVDESVLPHMNLEKIERPPFKERDCLKNQFFHRLLALTEAFVFMRQHEVFAHGFELMSRNDFYNNPVLQKYYLNIYGMIAVALAQLNVDYNWCMLFLQKAIQFANVCSQSLDILYYQQNVFMYHNVYRNENLAFQKLFAVVPVKSQFYIMSFKLHIKSFVYKTENDLFKVLCLKRSSNQTQASRDLMMRSLIEIEYNLRKEKRFVHSCLSVRQVYEEVFEFSLALLEVYFLCYLMLKRTESESPTISRAKAEILAHQLKLKSDYRAVFFRHLSDSDFFDMPYVVREMNRTKEHLQTTERMYNNEHWGNICFTMFLLFEILKKDSNHYSLGKKTV